jgi:hypothetical protein
MDLAHKTIVFSFNYPHNFISLAFTGSMANHLQSKFNGFYSDHGSKAVFNVFYMSLDSENQTTLLNWIDANYNG